MKWLFIVLPVMGWPDASAQFFSCPVKEHSLAIGVTGIRLDDPFILSSPASGNAFRMAYRFSKHTAAEKQSFIVSWNKGLLTNEQGGINSTDFELRYAQGFSLIKSRNGRFRSYWGYSAHTSPGFTKASYENSNRYSWSTVNDLSFYQSAVYTTGKTQLILDIYVPVIGLSSRPAPGSPDHHTTNGLVYDSYNKLFFTSWHNQRSVMTSLEFRQALSERLDVSLVSRFSYYSLKAGDSYLSYAEKGLGLSGGVGWRLK